jgi:biotin---protein ligase
MTQALVYVDQGVCQPSAEAVRKELQSLLGPSIAVLKVGSNYLKDEKWEDKTVVLALGGGTCRQWDENLGPVGIAKIHDYVVKGGHYIGICAGAYFASAEVEFGEMKKTRALSFFSGRAIGPLVDVEDHLALKGARAAEVSFKIRDKVLQGLVYYQGGCLFDIDEDTEEVEIVGRYERLNKAASLCCKVGKGRAFLCGPHPEFEWTPAGIKESYYAELSQKLSAQEPYRRKIWEEIGIRLKL